MMSSLLRSQPSTVPLSCGDSDHGHVSHTAVRVASVAPESLVRVVQMAWRILRGFTEGGGGDSAERTGVAQADTAGVGGSAPPVGGGPRSHKSTRAMMTLRLRVPTVWIPEDA